MSESESDLSDAVEAPNLSKSPSRSIGQEAEDVNHGPKMGSQAIHEEDAIGSDDADYDIDVSQSADHSNTRDQVSSSEDSQLQGKRKAGTEVDDYENDPELYGLRRSVRDFQRSMCPRTNEAMQHRARTSRRIVRSTPFFNRTKLLTHGIRLIVTRKMYQAQMFKAGLGNDGKGRLPVWVGILKPLYEVTSQ